MDVMSPRGRRGIKSPRFMVSGFGLRMVNLASRASSDVTKVDRPSQATIVPATVAALRILIGASSFNADFNASG